MILSLFKNRKILLELAKNDFKKKYVTSYLGILWGFIPSVVTIIVYWFVFSIGFKSQPVNGYPYLLWLMCGLIPWFYFSDAVVSAMNCFVEYSYLVKKMVFQVEILPFVKVLSNFFVHLFFIVLLIVFFVFLGFKPNAYWWQIFYYTFALVCLVSAIGVLGSTINVFFRDFGHIITVALQALVWLTPVIWDVKAFSESVIKKLKFNPMFYIVQGYRDTFMGGAWFWENIAYMVYFWCAVFCIYIVGVVLMKRLKGHFSDLL